MRGLCCAVDARLWRGHNRGVMLETLDSTLRLAAIGEMVLVALVVARSRVPAPIRRGTAVLLGGVVCYLLQSVALIRPTAGPIALIEELGATFTALALWLFAHALFDARADRRVALAGGGALGAIIIATALPGGFGPACVAGLWLNRLGHLIVALFVIHALMIAIVSRADDLSEKRRRFALAFVAIVAAEALLVVGGEAWFGYGTEPLGWRLIEAVLIAGAGLVVGAALLEPDPDLIGSTRHADARAPDDLSPAERVLRDRLDAAMAQELWRRPGLAIGDLAAELKVPEHRLRALINRRLGYRNFSAFLNRHRIAAARALLADPAHVALPVLTIAMDLGYGSLAPFNRAFREATGQTPTDFRRAAFAETEKS